MNAASGRPAASTEGSVEGYGGMPPENFEKIKVVDAYWWHFGTSFFKIFIHLSKHKMHTISVLCEKLPKKEIARVIFALGLFHLKMGMGGGRR